AAGPPIPVFTPGKRATLAELIAKRIILKRPFLCRMDFEDFVATLLPDDPMNPSTPALPNLNTPFGAIQYALARRYEPTINGAIVPELTLAQFMEIPGLPEGDYTDANGNFLRTNPYKGANNKLRMMARVNYFVSDVDQHGNPLTVQRQHCTLN